MGCDIHLMLERRRKYDKKHIIRPEKKNEDGTINHELSWTDKKDDWRHCCIFRKPWGDRVYGMFAYLSNVRNYFEERIEPLPDRGFPEDANHSTFIEYHCLIVPDDVAKDNDDNERYEDFNYVSESDAKKYVEDGYSEKVMHKNTNYPNDEEKEYIVHPDYHSPNYCSTEEMEKGIKMIFYKEEPDEYGNHWKCDYIEWLALLGVMKGYEESGEYECRAVYWFDN